MTNLPTAHRRLRLPVHRIAGRGTAWGESDRAVRQALVVVVAAAILAAGVTLLIGRAAGYGHLLSSLRNARPWWLVLALPAEVIAYVGYVLALRRSTELAGGPSLDAGLSARLALASLGATRVVVAGGPGVLYWGLRRARLSRRGAAARIAALNVLRYGVFVAAAALAALLVLVEGHGAAGQAIAGTWLLGIGATVAAIVVTAGLASVTARARHVLALLRHVLATREAPSAFLGAGLFWFGDVLCLWAGLRVFDVDVAIGALFLAYATAYLVTMLPILLGGVGGPEAALALALHAFGAPLAPALLGVLAYRLVSFWLPSIPGVALLTMLRRIGDQLEQSSPNAE